jgi:hypothetical protein
MEKQVSPATAKKLKDLAATSGPVSEDIVEDALAGYLEEVTSVRKTLDSRYEDLKRGRVKPIDGEEAFRKLREQSERRISWRRAATLAIAQNNLGALYAKGLGVRLDDVEAVMWYRKAVDQGYAVAQNNLAVRYDKGQAYICISL